MNEEGVLESISGQQLYSSCQIDTFFSFNYVKGVNYLKIELFSESEPLKCKCDTLISFLDIPHDRFLARRIILRNPS